jgi:hypothetical protein
VSLGVRGLLLSALLTVNLRAQNARLTKKGVKNSSTLETLSRIFSHAVSLRRRRVTSRAKPRTSKNSTAIDYTHNQGAHKRDPTKVNSPALPLHLSNRARWGGMAFPPASTQLGTYRVTSKVFVDGCCGRAGFENGRAGSENGREASSQQGPGCQGAHAHGL